METSDPSDCSSPPLPRGVHLVEEVPHPAGVPAVVHPGWAERFPWLVQGCTTRGEEGAPYDLALFGDSSARRVTERWLALGEALEMPRLVHGRQVHGSTVRVHEEGSPGLHLLPDTDGHATRTPGVLLTVSTADCVPVLMVSPGRRVAAALHAGWRGVAAGIMEEGLAVMTERLASDPSELHIHLGPSICGVCYEVGPEVHEALGLDRPAGPEPVDLRAVLARRAVDGGVSPESTTVSTRCTRCGDPVFFSHRGGDAERQIAYVGMRPT